jgi:hypothetical protein
MAARSRKGSKGKQTGYKGRGRRQPKPDSLLEQPTADAVGTVPCQLCGHPVDPKRMHPHMVRFHGAAIRSKGPPP